MSLSLDYRRDNRTEEQFKQDIKIATSYERYIMGLYRDYCKRKHGITLIVTDNGCDNSGKYTDNPDTKADYFIKNFNVPLEIKYANADLSKFRFKENQMKSYVKQNATILFVNGFETKEPLFTIIKAERLKQHMENQEPMYYEPWGENVYWFFASDFKWNSLI